MSDCMINIDQCYRPDQSGDCLQCKRVESEARYWAQWARDNGKDQWEAQKIKLRRLRSDPYVDDLVKVMNAQQSGN